MRNHVIIASAVLPAILLATEVSSVVAQTVSAPASKRIVLLRIVEQSAAKVATAKPIAKHKFASQRRISRHARLVGRHYPVQARISSEEARPAADAPMFPPASLQPPAPPDAEQLGKLLVD